MHADRIVVLESGRVAGIGTHAELMADCDTYREIVLSQLHEEIGAYVLEHWGMPAPIVDAARLHSRYAGESQSKPAQKLLYAANLVCRNLGIGDVHDGVSFNLEQVLDACSLLG